MLKSLELRTELVFSWRHGWIEAVKGLFHNADTEEEYKAINLIILLLYNHFFLIRFNVEVTYTFSNTNLKL